ncbi:MAG: tyrosine-type recombinase/integrase [Alkalinema sp. FL-bin-369]|nr:tyrosine-type recombinase/integrase [Leptolyngbyaceae cyanobacterium LF-bin-369]
MPRAKKGTVSVASQDKMLRLRWRHLGTSHTLPLGLADTPLHRRIAQGKASEIQADIAFDRFDPTLAKYKHDRPEPHRAIGDLFALWIETRRTNGTQETTIAAKYAPLRNHAIRYGLSPTNAKGFVEHLRSHQSASIANQNLSLLKNFGTWAKSMGFWDSNPFTNLPSFKGANQSRSGDPFTTTEIRAILTTCKADTHYAHYHDLIQFLFHSGCRPGEATNLRCSAVNLTACTVTLYASKTDRFRTLPLKPAIVAMLTDRITKPEALLFPSPQGKQINWRNFCTRCWKTICARAFVPYRVPYFTRHSFASHLIEGGATLPQTAHVLGHKDTRMVAKTYGRMVNMPDFPEF